MCPGVWKHSCYHYGKLSQLSSDGGGGYYESVCRQVCVTLRQSCYVYFLKQQTFSFHITQTRIPWPQCRPHYCFRMWMSMGKMMGVCMCVTERERENKRKVLLSPGCVWSRGMTFGISGGSEEDEYNYNNMENLMLKPQNGQDWCCLFSLQQLRNQSLYRLRVLPSRATHWKKKKVIRKWSDDVFYSVYFFSSIFNYFPCVKIFTPFQRFQ